MLPDSVPVAFLGGSTLGVGTLALAVSPDGTTLVYVARRGTSTQLFRRRLDESSVSPIAGNRRRVRSLLFARRSVDRLLRRRGVAQGTSRGRAAGHARAVVRAVRGELAGEWPHPRRPARGDDTGVGAGLGRDHPAIRLPPGTMAAAPSVLPGGRQALASVWFPSTVPGMGVVDLATGTMLGIHDRRAGPRGHGGCLPYLSKAGIPDSASGHIAFTMAGRLMVVPFDPATLRMLGPPAEMVNGIRTEASQRGQYAVTPDGTLIYAEGVSASGGRLVWADSAGRLDTLLFPTRSYGTFDLSPDGRRVVVMLYPPAAGPEVWVLDLDRRQSIKLATQGIPSVPRWWPDGRRVVFTERSPHPPYRFATVRQFPGSAGPRDTLLNEWSVNDLSSDTTKPEALVTKLFSSGVWLTGLSDSSAPVPVDSFPTAWGGTFSRDGRWIAYTSNEGGRYESTS